MQTAPGSGVLVAIPAYNEQATLGAVIEAVRAAVPEARIVVIDDASTDGTAEVARAHGVVTLRLAFNAGVGAAMRLAFVYGLATGARSVVQVDADGQHDPAQIPVLLEGLRNASVVVGSRFGEGDPAWVGRSRRTAMRALAAVVSQVSGTRLDDVTSGFRAADRKAMALFAEHYPSEYLGDTVESLVLSARAGLPIAQVPVKMRPRQGGEPSQKPIRSALFLGRAVMAVGVAMVRPSPRITRMGA